MITANDSICDHSIRISASLSWIAGIPNWFFFSSSPSSFYWIEFLLNFESFTFARVWFIAIDEFGRYAVINRLCLAVVLSRICADSAYWWSLIHTYTHTDSHYLWETDVSLTSNILRFLLLLLIEIYLGTKNLWFSYDAVGFFYPKDLTQLHFNVDVLSTFPVTSSFATY